MDEYSPKFASINEANRPPAPAVVAEKTVTLPVPGWVTVMGTDPWAVPISVILPAPEAGRMILEFLELLREFQE